MRNHRDSSCLTGTSADRTQQSSSFRKNSALNHRSEPKFHNLWLCPMGFERHITTEGYIGPADPALTGGRGGGQCPAPLPDRHHPMTLQIARATPDNPLLTPN